MKHLQLQPRLRLLADMVPAGAHLADIGTDPVSYTHLTLPTSDLV